MKDDDDLGMKEKGTAVAKEEEQQKDTDLGQLRKEPEEESAKAESEPGQSKELSRMFFDREMQTLEEQIHHLSERVEEIAEQVHSLAGLVEHIPSRVAALDLAATETRNSLLSLGATLTSAAGLGSSSGEAFWGVQVGAYRSRTGAKKGWAELLANQAAIQLNDLKVQYFLSKPLKSGNRLTLVVVNRYESQSAAVSVCNELRKAKVDCVAVRINP